MSPDVAAYLKSREPSGSHFQALKAELKALKAEERAIRSGGDRSRARF